MHHVINVLGIIQSESSITYSSLFGLQLELFLEIGEDGDLDLEDDCETDRDMDRDTDLDIDLDLSI